MKPIYYNDERPRARLRFPVPRLGFCVVQTHVRISRENIALKGAVLRFWLQDAGGDNCRANFF